jgi:hypothetical protein
MECALDVGEGNAVADQSREPLLVLGGKWFGRSSRLPAG